MLNHAVRHNMSLDTATQLQAAASPRGLRSGQLRRSASNDESSYHQRNHETLPFNSCIVGRFHCPLSGGAVGHNHRVSKALLGHCTCKLVTSTPSNREFTLEIRLTERNAGR